MWKALSPPAKLTWADPKSNVTFNLSCSCPGCAELDLCLFFPMVLGRAQLDTRRIYSTRGWLGFLLWSEALLWPGRWQRDGGEQIPLLWQGLTWDVATAGSGFWELCASGGGICTWLTAATAFISLAWPCMEVLVWEFWASLEEKQHLHGVCIKRTNPKKGFLLVFQHFLFCKITAKWEIGRKRCCTKSNSFRHQHCQWILLS